jgi:hypothetical protein
MGTGLRPQAPVVALCVVVLDKLAEGAAQVTFAERNDVPAALLLDRANEPFGVRVQIRAAWRQPQERHLWWPNTRSAVTQPSNSGGAARRTRGSATTCHRSAVGRRAQRARRDRATCEVLVVIGDMLADQAQQMPLPKHNDVIEQLAP